MPQRGYTETISESFVSAEEIVIKIREPRPKISFAACSLLRALMEVSEAIDPNTGDPVAGIYEVTAYTSEAWHCGVCGLFLESPNEMQAAGFEVEKETNTNH